MHNLIGEVLCDYAFSVCVLTDRVNAAAATPRHWTSSPGVSFPHYGASCTA